MLAKEVSMQQQKNFNINLLQSYLLREIKKKEN
jgi:hypothetical protein